MAGCVVFNAYGLSVLSLLSLMLYLDWSVPTLWLLVPTLFVLQHTVVLRINTHLVVLGLAVVIPVKASLFETPVDFGIDHDSQGDEVVQLPHSTAEVSLPMPSIPSLKEIALRCLSATTRGTLRG